MNDSVLEHRVRGGFKPFIHTFICPGCNRPLPLYVQPLHLHEVINCPRCNRPLTMMIRQEIRDHLAGH